MQQQHVTSISSMKERKAASNEAASKQDGEEQTSTMNELTNSDHRDDRHWQTQIELTRNDDDDDGKQS